MVLTLRRGPSGPPAVISDTIVEPGELLGNPLDATTTEPAEAIDGSQAGAIVRYSGVLVMSIAPGTYNNFEIPDGVQVVDLDPQAGNVVITGFKMLGDRGNRGAFITLSKTGSDGAVILTNLDPLSDPENQITTPLGANYDLINSNETCDLQVLERSATPTKWQVIDRLIPASGIASELGGFGVDIAVAVPFVAGGGGAPDDVTIIDTALLPYQVRVLDVILMISTAVVGSTATVRNQAGGGGTALSSALSTAATGTVRNNDTATRTTSLGLFLRRSDSGIAGTAIVIMGRV